MDLGQSLDIVSRSDAGRVRPHNEDAVYCNAAAGLAVLADGMGGYNAGEVASGLVAECLGRILTAAVGGSGADAFRQSAMPQASRRVATAIAAANREVYEMAQRRPECAGMGTTLAMALFFDDALLSAHVGDSRLYRLRAGSLQQLTRDHSLLQERLDSGQVTPAQARRSPIRNLLTRAVGVDRDVEAELQGHAVQAGDVYLLCSDGLTDMVEDAEIAAILRQHAGQPPQAAERLVAMANEAGGRDNVTVIVVRVPAIPGLGKSGGLTRWPDRFK